jgi:cytochrome c biogenesis protein CcmG/thiol:disulfide interchange protein DsbE
VRRSTVLGAVLVLALLLLGLALRGDRSPLTAANSAERIPVFSLPRLRFPEQSLASSEVLGQVSLVNVWATWCVPCRQEHGMLLEIAASGVAPIYGLNYKDSRQAAIRWLDQLGDPFVSTGFDEGGRVGAELGVHGVPETYILRPDGTIAHRHIGMITDEGWTKSLLPLIRKLKETRG